MEGIRLPFFDFIFSLITHLGEETVFIAISLFVFWCVSKNKGYYILTVGFVGTTINQFLKLIFRIPRPWVLDESFTIVESARGQATGYSFPSGHTQNSVGTFGAIAYTTKRRWVRILSIAICMLVPFSRLYLGVHTPLDVGVSVIVALVLIFATKPVLDKAEKNPYLIYILLGVFFVLSLAFVIFAEHYLPEEQDTENLNEGIKNAYTLFGGLVGLIIGYPIEKKYINFDTSGKWYTQILKFVLGLLLLLGLKSGLKALLTLIFGNAGIAHAIRYMIVVVFAIIVWPLTFELFKRFEKISEEKHEKISENKS